MSEIVDQKAKKRSSSPSTVPSSNPAFDASFVPDKFDVLAGRGGNCYNHPGNLYYRELIETNLLGYIKATTKHARGTLVTNIVETICASSPNGFLRFNSKTRTWTQLTSYEARQKVGQTIREALTRRDESKRKACQDRRANNKAKRCANKEKTAPPAKKKRKKKAELPGFVLRQPPLHDPPLLVQPPLQGTAFAPPSADIPHQLAGLLLPVDVASVAHALLSTMNHHVEDPPPVPTTPTIVLSDDPEPACAPPPQPPMLLMKEPRSLTPTSPPPLPKNRPSPKLSKKAASAAASSKHEHLTEMIKHPSSRDVLCGRGSDYYQHEGNMFFRKVISAALKRYTEAKTKHAKSSIVTGLYHRVRDASPHGFVRYDENIEGWLQLTEYEARQKVGQTIRETLTQRDPLKRARNRDKRAHNKLKRMGELPEQQQDWPIDGADEGAEEIASGPGVAQKTAESSRVDAPAKPSAAREIHPLESILVAMSVKRQQQELEIGSIARSMLPTAQGIENTDLAESSPLLRDRYLAIIAATTKELNGTKGISSVAHP